MQLFLVPCINWQACTFYKYMLSNYINHTMFRMFHLLVAVLLSDIMRNNSNMSATEQNKASVCFLSTLFLYFVACT